MAKFNLTVQLQLQSPSNIGAVVSQLQKQLGSIAVPVSIQSNTKQIKAASTAIGLVNTESIDAGKSVQKLGGTLGIAARRFGAISIATGSFLAFTRAVKNSVAEAIVFQRELNKIEQTTGASAKSLGELRDRVFELSTGLGVSSQELIVAARTLAQAGFSAKTASGALEILAQTDLAATFDSIQDTTEGSIALLQQFGREAIKAGQEVKFLEQSLSSINAVSKAFAVESADIISAIRKTGGSFETAGGSINELIALFTSVRATTRESADTIATAFRTIFTRIQKVETINKLRELGIVLQDTEGKFIGPLEAIEALSAGLSVLDTKDFRFSQIVSELGGFRQIGKVIPLLKQFAITQDALNIAQEASGGVAVDAAIAQKSLAVQITRVREEFKAMVEGFTESAVFSDFATGALNLASALIKVAEAIKPILPLITILAGLKLGQALGGFAGITGKGGLISNLVGGQRKATGGTVKKFATGGLVPVKLMPGEIALDRSGVAKAGGINQLNKINRMKPAKYASGGFVGPVPGSGNADTFATAMEPGGFVIRKRAVKALNQGAQNFAAGGKVNRKAYVFDFDDTLASTGASSFEDYIGGEKSAALIAAGAPTKYAEMAAKRARAGNDIYVLTSRAEDEYTQNAIQQFMIGKVGATPKGIIGVAQRFTDEREPGAKPGTTRKLSIASKKAKILQQLSAQYDKIAFLDDGIENVLAARQVDGVKALQAQKPKKMASGGTIVFSPKEGVFGGVFFNPLSEDTYLNTPASSVESNKEALYNKLINLAPKVKGEESPDGFSGGKIFAKAKAQNERAFLSAAKDFNSIEVANAAGERGQLDISLINRLALNESKGDEKLYNELISKKLQSKIGRDKVTIPKNNGELTSKSDLKDFQASIPSRVKGQDSQFTSNALEASFKRKGSKTGKDVKIFASGKDVPALYPSGQDIDDTYRYTVSKIIEDGLADIVKNFSQALLKDKVAGASLDGSAYKNAANKLTQDLSSKNSITGYLFEGAVEAVTGIKTAGQKANFDLDLRNSSSGNLSKLVGQFPPSLEFADIKSSYSAGSNILSKKIPNQILDTPDSQIGKYVDDIIYRPYANGGKVLGLTMGGETILSKKDAQGIGYDTLDAINKSGKVPGNRNKDDVLTSMDVGGYVLNKAATKKYAKGGRVQRFAAGGSVPVNPGGIASDLINAERAFSQAFLRVLDEVLLAAESKYKAEQSPIDRTKKPISVAPGGDASNLIQSDRNSLKAEKIIREASRAALKDQVQAVRNEIQEINTLAKISGEVVDANEAMLQAMNKVESEYGVLHGSLVKVKQKAVSAISAKNDFTGPPVQTGKTRGVVGRAFDKASNNFQERVNKGEDPSARTQQLAQSFLFMGGAVASVIPQLGFLEQSVADMTTQATVAATSFYGIGGTLTSSLSGPIGKLDQSLARSAASGNRFAKGFSAIGGAAGALNIALLGLTAVVGITQYVVANFRKEQELYNNKVKELFTSLGTTGSGNLQDITQTSLKAAEAGKKAENASTLGYSAGGAGLVAGATAGAFLAPVTFGASIPIGAAVGGVIGGAGGAYAGSSLASGTLDSSAVDSLKASAVANFAATKAVYDFTEAMKYVTESVSDTAQILALSSKGASDLALETVNAEAELARAQIAFNGSPNSDAAKQSIESAKTSLNAAKSALAENVPKLLGSISNQVNAVISEKGALTGTNDQRLDQVRANISGSLEGLGAAMTAAGRTAEQQAKTYLALEKSIINGIDSAQKQEAIQNALIAAKEAELNLILQFNGALTGLVEAGRIFADTQTNASRVIASSSGSYQASLIAFGTTFDDISNVGNKAEFSKIASAAAGPLGSAGKELADQVINSAETIKRLRIGLNAQLLENVKSGSSLGGTSGIGNIENSLRAILGKNSTDGADLFDSLSPGLRKVLTSTIQATGGEGAITQDTVNNIIENFKTNAAQYAEVLKASANLQNDYLGQYNDVSKAEIDARNKYTVLQEGYVSVQEKGLSRLEKVFNGRLSSSQLTGLNNQRSSFRNTRAQIGLTGTGAKAGDIDGIANRLAAITSRSRDINTQQKSNLDFKQLGELNREQGLLADQSAKLTRELQRLTDQSERASDIMSEIDREQSKREFVANRVEDFVLGTNEQRNSINQVSQGAQIVAQTGTFQSVPEEIRKSVGDFLQQLGDLNPGGFVDNARKNALANDIQSATGLDRGTSFALANKASTSKEDRLINELQVLNQVELKAQAALINAQGQNTQSIANLVPEVQALANVIGNELVEAIKQQNAEIAAQRARSSDVEAATQAKIDAEKSPDAIKAKNEEEARKLAAYQAEAEARIEKQGTRIGEVIVNAIERLLQNVADKADQNANLGQTGRGAPNSQGRGYATGGIVYREGGGSIFKPQGTDTVPAMLTPGEFVVKKSAVDHYGSDTLEKLNNKTLYAAGGGPVGAPIGGAGLLANNSQQIFTKEMMVELYNRFQALSIQSNYVAPEKMVSDINELLTAIDNQNIAKDSRLDKYKAILAANRDRFQKLSGREVNQTGQSRGDIFKRKALEREGKLSRVSPGFRDSNYKEFLRSQQTQTGEANRALRQQRKQDATTRVLGEREQRANENRNSAYKRREFASTFAKGGSVSDTVPAMLTPGEFVVNASAVSKYGNDFMNNINNKVVGYNKGGPVYKAGGGSITSSGSGGSSQMLGIDTSSLQVVFNGFASTLKSNLENLLTQLPQSITSSMKNITETMNNIVQGFNNMKWTMEHNFSGSIAIAGLNVPEMAEMLKGAITNQVVDIVNMKLQAEANKFKQG